MKWLDKHTLKLDKEINQLDQFVIDFIKILEKHTDYVVISGYVSILFGRNRNTDDVDIIIPRMNLLKFKNFYEELLKQGYWCLNSSELNDIYELLDTKHGVRFAIEPNISPNIELKFSKNEIDEEALNNKVIIKLGKETIKTSILELQIAFKEEVLKSNKDMEDAKQLRETAKDNIDIELVNKYKRILKGK